MDKVKLEFKIPKMKTIEYGGIEIKIVPFLTTAQQVVLINRYLEDYFKEGDTNLIPLSNYRYLEAEYNLLNNLLSLATDIDTTGLDENLLSDSNFSHIICENIDNFWDFYAKLTNIIEEIKEQKNSVPLLLSGLIEKAYGILDKVSDISPEQIEKLQQTSTDLMEKLKESQVLGKVASPKTRKTKPQ